MKKLILDNVTFANQALEVEKEIPERHFIDFTQLPAFGMWADREDRRESVEYIRKLRQEQWSRNKK